MTETKPSVLSRADIERIAMAMEERGASITVQDPRVSSVQNWLIGLVGTGALVVMGWMANSIDNLNRNMERSIAKQEFMEQRIQRLEEKR